MFVWISLFGQESSTTFYLRSPTPYVAGNPCACDESNATKRCVYCTRFIIFIFTGKNSTNKNERILNRRSHHLDSLSGRRVRFQDDDVKVQSEYTYRQARG